MNEKTHDASGAAQPLLTVAMQGEAIPGALEGLLTAHSLGDFTLSSSPTLLKDSQLNLPPGTLGEAMAKARGLPAGALADVPQMVFLFNAGWRSRPEARAELVEALRRLTGAARSLAQSEATRALVLHTADRVLRPEVYLQESSPLDDTPDMSLFVWTDFLRDDRMVRTVGMEVFNLPNLAVDLHPDASQQAARDAFLLLRASSYQLLTSTRPPAAGDTFVGPPPESLRFGWTGDERLIRLAPATTNESVWRRIFH